MFSTARCFLPVRPQPHAATPCRRTPALTAVSARPHRGGSGPRRNRRSWDDGNDDDGDDRIDDSFFGDTQDEEAEDDDETPGPEQQRRPASPAPEPARQLRGSDVLRALQRAAAAKEAKKKKKKAGARPAARRQEKGGDGVKVQAAGEVRPIEIRPEWAPRIRELELRVQQLVDKYHQH